MLTNGADETVGLALVDAARLMRVQFDRALESAGFGLTAGEARTLAHVALSPAMRQTTLAARMNVEPMTLVGFLDRLEGRGLIKREPDPTDRRAKLVRLTPQADPTLGQVQEIIRTVQGAAMQGFQPEEVETLRDLLTRLRKNMSGTEPGVEQQ
jgi:DNA-binding MarR family transcriptional regulator